MQYVLDEVVLSSVDLLQAELEHYFSVFRPVKRQNSKPRQVSLQPKLRCSNYTIYKTTDLTVGNCPVLIIIPGNQPLNKRNIVDDDIE